MKTRFLEFLAPLQKCRVPTESFLPISLFALRVPIPEEPSKRKQEAWNCLNARIKSLSEEYIQQVGENVISDLASRPSDAGLRQRERHSLQRLAGAWLAEFSSECKKDFFSLPCYLEALQDAGTGLADSEHFRPVSPQTRHDLS